MQGIVSVPLTSAVLASSDIFSISPKKEIKPLFSEYFQSTRHIGGFLLDIFEM